jgi:hypothetical protein
MLPTDCRVVMYILTRSIVCLDYLQWLSMTDRRLILVDLTNVSLLVSDCRYVTLFYYFGYHVSRYFTPCDILKWSRSIEVLCVGNSHYYIHVYVNFYNDYYATTKCFSYIYLTDLIKNKRHSILDSNLSKLFQNKFISK